MFSNRGIDIRLHYVFVDSVVRQLSGLVWRLAQKLDKGNFWRNGRFLTSSIPPITLHELPGHSVWQQYNVPVKQIILSPIGGAGLIDAHAQRKNRCREFVVAIAGPAVNFVIAI
ncbi:MAG: hypothetical protein H6667_14245 [Ardenticatenaceae bacterium]|nr:hypothetical protein [Ardenticatenaceae bacterium]